MFDNPWLYEKGAHTANYGSINNLKREGYSKCTRMIGCRSVWCYAKTVSFSNSIFTIASGRFLAHLAYMLMSLCNHDLSIVCHCHHCWCCHHHHHHHHWCHHLWTAVPVTALLIETSYLAVTCTYTPSICT